MQLELLALLARSIIYHVAQNHYDLKILSQLRAVFELEYITKFRYVAEDSSNCMSIICRVCLTR